MADAANYPFCTIEPNVGIVEVPDERLPVLAKIVKTEKIVPAVVEFYDIAGIVKGASEGEGLGNKFLSHIREVAAIVHVVRLFEDANVIHVSNVVDPKSDIDVIDAELILADLETLKRVESRKSKVQSKSEEQQKKVVSRLIAEMNKGISARNVDLTDEEKALIRELNLLTMKPILYAFNVSEEQLTNRAETERQIDSLFHQLQSVKISNQSEQTDFNRPASPTDGSQLISTGFNYLLFNAKLENDVLAFSLSEQKEYLNQFKLEDTGLNRMIKKCYEILGLISFLTAGTLEARAWTIQKGELAPEAAGTIHTDFTKKFIKADICTYDDFVANGGWIGAREIGKVVSAGRDYEMKDGDVVEFKIGA